MSMTNEKAYTNFVLPQNLVSKLDVSHLVRDAERFDNELTEFSVRQKAGVEGGEYPVASSRLATFLDLNQLSFDESTTRTAIVKELRTMKDALPVIHMTFSSDADRESLEAIAKWTRDSVHGQAVIEDGLQPSLVAGVYVRTPNHVHDLSLRETLRKNRDLLAKELEAIRGN